jgi:hypothetical protein
VGVTADIDLRCWQVATLGHLVALWMIQRHVEGSLSLMQFLASIPWILRADPRSSGPYLAALVEWPTQRATSRNH